MKAKFIVYKYKVGLIIGGQKPVQPRTHGYKVGFP